MKFIEVLILLSFGILFYAKLCANAGLHWVVVFSPLICWLSNIVIRVLYDSFQEWNARRPRRPNWLK